MPHVNIKYFPSMLTAEEKSTIAISITKLLASVIHCDEGAVSVALEPIEKQFWDEKVYIPEMINRKNLLIKLPNY